MRLSSNVSTSMMVRFDAAEQCFVLEAVQDSVVMRGLDKDPGKSSAPSQQSIDIRISHNRSSKICRADPNQHLLRDLPPAPRTTRAAARQRLRLRSSVGFEATEIDASGSDANKPTETNKPTEANTPKVAAEVEKLEALLGSSDDEASGGRKRRRVANEAKADAKDSSSSSSSSSSSDSSSSTNTSSDSMVNKDFNV